MKQLNINHRKVAVASPWANGLVERVNRFLKTSLSKLIDSPDGWKAQLAKVQYVINNTYHSVIKSTPAQLMFGFDQRNHVDASLSRLTKALTDCDSELVISREEKRVKAIEATALLQQYNKQYVDQRSRKPTIYKKGDFVVIRDTRVKPGQSGKLKPSYKGPFIVDKELGYNRYVIKDVPGFNHSTRPLNTILSSDKLKKWTNLPSIE